MNKEQLTPQQLADAKEQGEQDFIQRLLNDLSNRGLPTGDWDCEDDPAEFIAAQVAPFCRWTQDMPTEQGEYWLWQGDLDSAPIHVHVFYSGHSSECFLPAGQYGWTRAQDMKELKGAWWMASVVPAMPGGTTMNAQLSTEQQPAPTTLSLMAKTSLVLAELATARKAQDWQECQHQALELARVYRQLQVEQKSEQQMSDQAATLDGRRAWLQQVRRTIV